jgi:hypothetical protein
VLVIALLPISVDQLHIHLLKELFSWLFVRTSCILNCCAGQRSLFAQRCSHIADIADGNLKSILGLFFNLSRYKQAQKHQQQAQQCSPFKSAIPTPPCVATIPKRATAMAVNGSKWVVGEPGGAVGVMAKPEVNKKFGV